MFSGAVRNYIISSYIIRNIIEGYLQAKFEWLFDFEYKCSQRELSAKKAPSVRQ